MSSKGNMLQKTLISLAALSFVSFGCDAEPLPQYEDSERDAVVSAASIQECVEERNVCIADGTPIMECFEQFISCIDDVTGGDDGGDDGASDGGDDGDDDEHSCSSSQSFGGQSSTADGSVSYSLECEKDDGEITCACRVNSEAKDDVMLSGDAGECSITDDEKAAVKDACIKS